MRTRTNCLKHPHTVSHVAMKAGDSDAGMEVTLRDLFVHALVASFSHHRTAAMTKNSDVWLQKAIGEELSVQEFRQAITDSRDRLSEAEQARHAAERLIQAGRRFNEPGSPGNRR